MNRANNVFYWLPCAVVFVSTAYEDKRDIMTATAMFVFEQFSIKSIPGRTGEALIPEGAAAWMTCDVESSHDIKGYRMFIGRVVDQEDLGAPPMVWQKDGFFGLKPVG